MVVLLPQKRFFERFWMKWLFFIIEEQSVDGELKFIQNRWKKNGFEAKGRLYTTGKVIQRLFIIDLYTQLAIYGYKTDCVGPLWFHLRAFY